MLNIQSRRFKFIGCEIIHREACLLAARSRHIIDLQFLRKGLHDMPTATMLAKIQAAVDEVTQPAADGLTKPTYEAILLGYARCNDGLAGLTARDIPLVIPRAHDCITFFFGSRDGYKQYFDEHPGTYYRTTGWSERGEGWSSGGKEGVMNQLGLDRSYAELLEKYGKENADFIAEFMGNWQANYKNLCYVEMGVCDEGPFIQAAQQDAAEKGWTFERRPGDMSLLERLMEGDWNDDFVVLRPGQKLVARNDARVLDAE